MTTSITVKVKCVESKLYVDRAVISASMFHLGSWPTRDYTVRYVLDSDGPYVVQSIGGSAGFAISCISPYRGMYPKQMVCFLPHEWNGLRVRREVLDELGYVGCWLFGFVLLLAVLLMGQAEQDETRKDTSC